MDWSLGSTGSLTMNPALPRLLVGILVLWTGLALVSGQNPPDFCFLPAATGPCKDRMPRFFYNPSSKQCERFIYGSCGGNKNNFGTLQECWDACVEKPGICPKPIQKCFSRYQTCQNDWDCFKSLKCCNSGCLMACLRVV